MKVQHRSKVLRSLTPEGLKRLLNWPNQKAQVLDVLRQLPPTDEFFGPERHINQKVRIPETWTQLREALRDLTPARNYGIGLIYCGKCRRCGGRFNATSPRKHYCSKECEKQTEYQTRLERGDFKKAMSRKRQRDRQAAADYAAKRKQIKEEKQKLKAESLYLKVVFGKFNKRTPYLYNYILRQLGSGEEARGHNKIVDWYKRNLKFEKIPAKDQKIFHESSL